MSGGQAMPGTPGAALLADLTGELFQRITRYRQSNDAAEILGREADREAAALWQALQAAGWHPDTAGEQDELANASLVLGWLYYLRYDLIEGESAWPELARAVVAVAPYAGQPEFMPSGLGRLLGPEADHDVQAGFALGFLTRSKQLDDPALLNAGIALLAPAAAALPDDDTDRGIRLSNLCLALRTRFERDATVDDLDRAIAVGEQAAAIPGMAEVDPVSHRFNLSYAYWDRFRTDGRSDDIVRAIALLEDVAASFAPGPQRSEWLTEVARAQIALYEHAGDPAVLAQATAAAQRAAADLPHDPKEAATALFTLAGVLYHRHQRGGSADDLRRARELAAQCLAVLPPGHPARPSYLTDVARFHLGLHSAGLAPDGLRTAVELSEQAVAERPRDLAGLSILSTVLQERHRHAGNTADLDRAIGLGDQAVTAGQGGDQLLSLTGGAYLTRYQHAGLLDDLEQAIGIWQALLAGSRGNRAARADWASLLGNAYQQRFTSIHDMADLDRAIELGELAVAETSPADPRLGSRLGKLAIAYQRAHDIGAGTDYRAEAIEVGERAVTATPESDPDYAGWLSNLAIAYLTPGYTAAPTRADIDRAVELSEQALAAHPGHHGDHVRLMANLAVAYRDQVAAGDRGVDVARVRELARKVTETEAVPTDQVWGRHAIGMLAQVTGEHRLATELLDAAVTLLPEVVPGEGDWADQQYRLGEHMGLVGSAVAAHCAAGDPAGAVEAAELGRGVLLSRQADARADLTQPEKAHPSLAELAKAAEGGSVVLVNASWYRGDAIIIRPDSAPLLVELPGLDLKDVEERAIELTQAAGGGTSSAAVLRKQRVLPEILGWLWDSITAPVLDALPTEPSPHRIWWLPTGFLSVFPLHAAGHPGQPGVLDAAVSSYIPTMRKLQDFRSRTAPSARRQLVVALTHTPGLPDLQGTADEAAGVHASYGGASLTDDQATADHVLAALKEATWAHFACHAQADLLSPASGGLWLRDRLLRLPEIGALRLPHAELAYLSACSTAYHGGRTGDETLHLASAFHLAGFRHVIASLWPLSDHAAADAARTFYRNLLHVPAADSAAHALHQVTNVLRAAQPARPDLWAALIHSGP